MKLLMFVAATAVLALTPGPNTILTVSRTLSQGRRAGALVVMGVEAAFLLHLAAATAGLSVLLIAVPAVFEGLRMAGVVYLLFLAWRIVTGRHTLNRDARGEASSAGQLLRMGFVSNALNPKTAMFYLAAFPQFVRPGGASIIADSLPLGVTHILVSTVCNMLYVFGAGTLQDALGRRPMLAKLQRWLCGSCIVVFALKLLSARRPVPLHS